MAFQGHPSLSLPRFWYFLVDRDCLQIVGVSCPIDEYLQSLSLSSHGHIPFVSFCLCVSSLLTGTPVILDVGPTLLQYE